MYKDFNARAQLFYYSLKVFHSRDLQVPDQAEMALS